MLGAHIHSKPLLTKANNLRGYQTRVIICLGLSSCILQRGSLANSLGHARERGTWSRVAGIFEKGVDRWLEAQAA